MTCLRKEPRRKGKGQALVEFALVAPIFFVLLLGIIEGGRFVFFYEVLNNATREGARYAIVNGANSLGGKTGPPAPGTTSLDPTGDNVRVKVRASAFGMQGSAIAVDPRWYQSDGVTPGDNSRGMTVKVTATFTYNTLVPLLPLPAITVRAESSLVVNN